MADYYGKENSITKIRKDFKMKIQIIEYFNEEHDNGFISIEVDKENLEESIIQVVVDSSWSDELEDSENLSVEWDDNFWYVVKDGERICKGILQ